MTTTDSELARQLDAHLGEHPRRDRDCIVCTVVLATYQSWRQNDDGTDAVLRMTP